MNPIHIPWIYLLKNFLTFIVIGIVFLLIISWLLKWLWNITITRIFNIREITFWEAFRLIIIAGILFGSGRGNGIFNFSYTFPM